MTFCLGESTLPSLPTRLGLSTRREHDIEDLHGKKNVSTQMETDSKSSGKLLLIYNRITLFGIYTVRPISFETVPRKSRLVAQLL